MSTPHRHTLGLDIGGSSTKLVVLGEDGEILHRASSQPYAHPSLEELTGVIQKLLVGSEGAREYDSVGVCLPGQFEPDQETVRYAANIPELSGQHIPGFVRTILDADLRRVCIVPDAQAAAVGSWTRSPEEGRVLAIALGTGVGVALLENGSPITLGPGTAGHFGQIDVSLSDDAPVGPCGGRGSLEAYIGLPVLRARFGESCEMVTNGIATMPDDDPALRALARAMRIAHAIYTPDTVRLLGGIGMALEMKIDTLKALVDRELTAVANPDWKLTAENDTYLAAFGAAVSASGA